MLMASLWAGFDSRPEACKPWQALFWDVAKSFPSFEDSLADWLQAKIASLIIAETSGGAYACLSRFRK